MRAIKLCLTLGIAMLPIAVEQADQEFQTSGEAGAAAGHREAVGAEAGGLGVGEDDAHRISR